MIKGAKTPTGVLKRSESKLSYVESAIKIERFIIDVNPFKIK